MKHISYKILDEIFENLPYELLDETLDEFSNISYKILDEIFENLPYELLDETLDELSNKFLIKHWMKN